MKEAISWLGGHARFSLGAWDELVEKANRFLNITAGEGIHVSNVGGITTVSLAPQTSFVHPWRISTNYDTEERRWVARVHPGFVNGIPAEAAGELLVNYPDIPLTAFRNVLGQDGGRIPPFFAAMGLKREKVALPNDMGVINISEESSSAQKLLACDFVLSAFRPTVSMDITFPGNLVTGEIINYALRWDISQAFKSPSVGVVMKWEPPKPPSMLERMLGIYRDEPFDQLLIGTAYFLSPENPKTDMPDDEWQPFVEQSLFWNLTHYWPKDPPKQFPQVPLGLSTAMFVGRYTVAPAATFGLIQAEMQKAILRIMSDSMKGTFYTA